MKIEWNIVKKRGNYRPVLHYTAVLNEFERSLCLPAVQVKSTIPKPPEAGWTFCWPGQNERGPWTPADWYYLMTPSHKDGKTSDSLKLPWRADNAYPEVEDSFTVLRTAFEAALSEALESAPLSTTGHLETSGTMRQIMAPAFMAQRILGSAG
jgi:hypothetical protein